MSARTSTQIMRMNARRNASASTSGAPSSTRCPSPSSSRAAPSTARTHSGSTRSPSKGRVVNATRSAPGGRSICFRNATSGSGAKYGAPASRPAIASSIAAESRTVRVSTCSATQPCQICPASGPVGTRPRLGFSPNTPQHDAGIRIDPPPSPPLAIGTIRAATAAADPPLDPPGVRPGSQGLRVAPKSSDSVTGSSPSSGVAVLPKITSPARLERATTSESRRGR